MALFRGLQKVALDLVVGAAAFGVFYAGLRWTPENHASILFLMAETIYFLAGAVRGHGDPRDPFMRVFLIVVPGTSTILLLAYTGYAFTAHLYIICFLGAALFGTLTGILLGQFFAKGNTRLVSLIALAVLAINLLAVRTLIPRVIAASVTKNTNILAPSFAFSTIDGAAVGSDQLRGKVVLLAFWATWCRPCIGELPRLQQIYYRYREDPRVVIWVVDSGIGNDTIEKQRRIISAQHWDLAFAADSENLEYKMGFHGLPKLVLLYRAGRVRWLHDGFDASEDLVGQLTKRIDALLGSG